MGVRKDGLFLQAALNGDRVHPAAPRTAEAIAEQARIAVAAGAQSVHVHAFDADGRETFDAVDCARTLRAIRAACPGIPISLTTSAAIDADAGRRFRRISEWTELPDLVTANQGEDGILALCGMLLDRGVGIEAGLLAERDARLFVASGLAKHCRRVLIEPLAADPQEALQLAATMEAIVTDAGIDLEQVHHGDGIASWAVNRRAVSRGHGIRTGLEDTPVLPDGRQARDNGDLVAEAAGLIASV
ncbi:MAG: 3-keto-5-aminohexanoate cleavage protein [Mesorhizobium sp.]